MLEGIELSYLQENDKKGKENKKNTYHAALGMQETKLPFMPL
jgi:hypothetical protein